jgi:hypothetical protein
MVNTAWLIKVSLLNEWLFRRKPCASRDHPSFYFGMAALLARNLPICKH